MKIFEGIHKYIFIEFGIWFLILCIAVGAFRIYHYNKEKELVTYQIFMPDVDGLIAGSPVKFMGVQVGYIEKVKIVANDVYLKIVITNKDVELPKGSLATVEFNGMGGSKSLEVYPPTKESLASNKLIVVQNPKRLHDSLGLLNDMFDKGLIERLQGVLKDNFVRLSYSEGIGILEDAVAKGHKFEFPVYWGVDLASEHERYLVEDHFKRPVILTDYPKEIKAFYMKQNEDGKTVRAMDVLFPKIGEIIGGSEREADYDKLLTRIKELNIPMKDMWWYLDTRKYGSCPHSGFGLGFERLLLFVTGMANIRDVIPFPRTPHNAEF